MLVLGLAGDLLGLIERFLRVWPALQTAVHLRQSDIDLAILRLALEQSFYLLQTGLGLAHVGELRRVDHL